jgi:8-oxo-dGTP pyrophosphatase MutT (NUDIX family)
LVDRFFQLIGGTIMTVYLTLRAIAAPVAFGACAIVEDEEGRVLLVRHSYRAGWHLPGGGVGSGEPPTQAILRELKEEIGLLRSEPPEFIGLFTRRLGWVSNVIALYRVRDAEILFKRNFEIRAVQHVDPANPPSGTTAATRRRLAEHLGQAERSPYW